MTIDRIGPDMPDNDMVICPHCTSQFVAVPVNVQSELRRLRAFADQFPDGPDDEESSQETSGSEPGVNWPGEYCPTDEDLEKSAENGKGD